MREKIIVIGTEKEAEAFLYKNSGKYEVVLFVDKNPRRNAFRGSSVITFDSIAAMRKDIKYKIVIATNEEEYIEISRELTRYDLEEFKDFFYFEALDKKLAFLWGNCYIRELAKFMVQFPSFNEKFWIYPLFSVYEYDRFYFSNRFFQSVSLFIYQDISSVTNGMLYSSDGMCEKITEKAIKIKIPNLYKRGFAFFPQAFYRGLSDMRDCEQKFVVNTDNHDIVITQKRREGISVEQIAFQIQNEIIFDQEKTVQEFHQMFKDLEVMDMECDVKIAAWIKRHYQDEIIFIDPGHVSKAVFVEYVKQILMIIGLYEIEKENIQKAVSYPSELRMPVYGCVRDAMQLRWVDEANRSIKKGSWVLDGEALDILEYVKQYSYICVENLSV